MRTKRLIVLVIAIIMCISVGAYAESYSGNLSEAIGTELYTPQTDINNVSLTDQYTKIYRCPVRKNFVTVIWKTTSGPQEVEIKLEVKNSETGKYEYYDEKTISSVLGNCYFNFEPAAQYEVYARTKDTVGRASFTIVGITTQTQGDVEEDK